MTHEFDDGIWISTATCVIDYGRNREFWIALVRTKEIRGFKRGQWMLERQSINEWHAKRMERPTFEKVLVEVKARCSAGAAG